MKCSKIQLLIDDVGDLDRLPVEAARHVAACAACERFGRDLAELRALLREPGRVSAPADFDARLARRLRAARELPAPRRSWVAALVPAHGLATAAALGLLVCGSVAVTRVMTTETAPVSRPGNVAKAETAAVEATRPTVGPPEIADRPASPVRVALKPRAQSQRKLTEPARAAASDAMILVRDEAGTRVYNIPTVLVGGERIVPAVATTAAPESSDAGVAF